LLSHMHAFCPHTANLEDQEQLTGSDKPWSDIVLLGLLSDTSTDRSKGLVKDAVRDWSSATLTRNHFSDIDLSNSSTRLRKKNISERNRRTR
jgi:hypothetical protein